MEKQKYRRHTVAVYSLISYRPPRPAVIFIAWEASLLANTSSKLHSTSWANKCSCMSVFQMCLLPSPVRRSTESHGGERCRNQGSESCRSFSATALIHCAWWVYLSRTGSARASSATHVVTYSESQRLSWSTLRSNRRSRLREG